jgi:sugar phosphate isomerase/epimerase
MTPISRRAFLGTAAALAASPALGLQDKPAWKIGGFTKVLQDLSYEKTAEAAVGIGWDGIECPVRAKGHVLPERVEEDLPRMVDALKAKNLEVLALATEIRGTDDPHIEKVLRTGLKLGIRLYRLGGFKYKEGISIPKQLDEFRARLKDVAALNRELGITGLYQNHSGNGYVGASVWDIHEMVKDFDPKDIGVHFDIGHATVESGLSWPTSFALVKDRIGAVIVKDFYWKHTPGEGAKTVWVPIGQGSIQPRFFGMLRASGFRGPITMQFEYAWEGGDGLESRLKALKQDNLKLREWVKV